MQISCSEPYNIAPSHEVIRNETSKEAELMERVRGACGLGQLVRGWPSDDNWNAAAMVDADSPVIEADRLARCYRDQEWWRRGELNFPYKYLIPPLSGHH